MHFLQHCSGPNQSPIAIHSRRSIPMNIPAIEFVFYHNLLPGSIKLHNNGNSLSLITPKPENFTQFPFVFGGKLRAEYEFVGLHFHWGDKNNRGSVRFISAIVEKLLGAEAFRGPCVSDVFFRIVFREINFFCQKMTCEVFLVANFQKKVPTPKVTSPPHSPHPAAPFFSTFMTSCP